jgi:TolA-binding protein
MFYGWKMAYDRYRGTERQLETTTRSLDGARRSAHNDRLLLLEFRSQSQRLQDEMAEDVERLQDQLKEADGEVDQVRANLVVLTRQAHDDREKYELRVNTAESKCRELERKLGASSVEELCLKQALSVAHAESERLNSVAEEEHKKYLAAASGEGLLKLVLVDHKKQITFLTKEVEKLKLSHKDTVDRLQRELSHMHWESW